MLCTLYIILPAMYSQLHTPGSVQNEYGLLQGRHGIHHLTVCKNDVDMHGSRYNNSVVYYITQLLHIL